jgi:hypothetical protein
MLRKPIKKQEKKMNKIEIRFKKGTANMKRNIKPELKITDIKI